MHQGIQMDLNSSSAASINQNPKKRNKNPFTFLFTRQNKSTPTSSYHLDEDQHGNSEGIFGAPLCDASKEGSSLWDLIVPDPVALCFHEISRRGLRTEAIDASVYDVHTLASLVKKYLRELPEPVIPNGFHEQLQQVNLSDAREGIRQLSAILIKLPFHNRQLIHAILLMAVKIQLHVEKNMMCPEALATVFAPVCTGFEQSLRKDTMPKSSGTKAPNKNPTVGAKAFNHRAHIKRNKHWTNIWKLMIEQHEVLIDTLNQQANQAKEKEQNPDATWRQHRTHYNMPSSTHTNQTLPSPFSTSGSTVLLPNDIIMAQFHPMYGYSQPETIREAVIPVAQPSTSNSHYANVQPYSQDLDLSEESTASLHSLRKDEIMSRSGFTIRKGLPFKNEQMGLAEPSSNEDILSRHRLSKKL
ncbi:Rho GTPase activation protein [Choanephora cucurbitarum]|nr:Rho GTPase activation protein [Choanephora cucurbitarum]